jgi:hypothetical protein
MCFTSKPTSEWAASTDQLLGAADANEARAAVATTAARMRDTNFDMGRSPWKRGTAWDPVDSKRTGRVATS